MIFFEWLPIFVSFVGFGVFLWAVLVESYGYLMRRRR